jgi:hypothetical protein
MRLSLLGAHESRGVEGFDAKLLPNLRSDSS